MGQMFDSTNPEAIPAELNGKVAIKGSVLANAEADWFDVEDGNANPDEVAETVSVKEHTGGWAIVYADEAYTEQMVTALQGKDTRFSPGSSWPQPGIYLWAADWTHEPHLQPSWAPVECLACQWTNGNPYDTSETVVGFPAEVAGYIDGDRSAWPVAAWERFASIHAAPTPAPAPAPAPPTEGMITVLLPQLQQGITAESVKAAQTLLGGLTVDGIFCPLTHARTVAYQAEHQLTQDGIIGLHTWGSLLGAPQ